MWRNQKRKAHNDVTDDESDGESDEEWLPQQENKKLIRSKRNRHLEPAGKSEARTRAKTVNQKENRKYEDEDCDDDNNSEDARSMYAEQSNTDCMQRKAIKEGESLCVFPIAHEKTYKCSTCSKLFARRDSLIIHSRTHTGERPYTCQTGGQSFAASGHLNVHIGTHTGERVWKCYTCDKCFTERRNLNKHLRTYSGHLTYKCDTCGALFAYKCSLTDHMTMHGAKREHTCHTCCKSYKHSDSLSKHMRSHSGERPYANRKSDTKSLTRTLGGHKITCSDKRHYACFKCRTLLTHSEDLHGHLTTHRDHRRY